MGGIIRANDEFPEELSKSGHIMMSRHALTS